MSYFKKVVNLRNISILSLVSVSSWYAGSYYQQKQIEQQLKFLGINLNELKLLKPFPALPILSTVSAATSIVPLESSNLFPSVQENETSTVGKRSREILKYGYPSFDNIRAFSDYVLSYDRRNRVANWVFEHLTKENIKNNPEVDRNKCKFKPDEVIHPFFRSDNSDYKNSSYDRGHLAAAGNHRVNQKLVEETFYLSNMAPQVGKGFNRDAWNRLEKHVRKLTRHNKNVYCCTGPLYLPKPEDNGKLYVKYEVIGKNHVAVPTHFFKIVVYETETNQLEMESYVMPNQQISDDIPLASFQVPPESIERAAGLLFFTSLSRDKLIKINGKKK